MTINEYLQRYPTTDSIGGRAFDAYLQGGQQLSIQASEGHRCIPQNNEGPYKAVEVGYASKELKKRLNALLEEDSDNNIWAFVPVEKLEEIFEEFGGIACNTLNRVKD